MAAFNSPFLNPIDYEMAKEAVLRSFTSDVISGVSPQDQAVMPTAPGGNLKVVLRSVKAVSSIACTVLLEDDIATALTKFSVIPGAPHLEENIFIPATNNKFIRADVTGTTTDLIITGTYVIIPSTTTY